METAQVLNVIEQLLNTAEHPDITEITRYGRDAKPGGQSPAGVKVTYGSGAQTFLFAVEAKAMVKPEPFPEQMPPLKNRALHTLKFLIDLFDVARPEVLTAWRPATFDGVGWGPTGLEIRCSDGGSAYLRATCASGPTGDPDSDPFPGYVIPSTLSA